jgi:hypothetical protein
MAACAEQHRTAKLRREASLQRELKNCWTYGRSLLFDQLEDAPPIRLVSRTTIWTIDPGSVQDAHQILDRWRESWSSNIPVNGDIVDDPTAVPPGFNLKRREWVLLNRFRTSQPSQGKCAYLMHRWGYIDSPICDCGFAKQTMIHIIECPLRSFEGGLATLHEVTPEAEDYLTNNRFYVGDSEISVIKVEGDPCDGKHNFKWPSIGYILLN